MSKGVGNDQIALINAFNHSIDLFRLKLAGCTTNCLSAQAALKLFLLLLKRYEKLATEHLVNVSYCIRSVGFFFLLFCLFALLILLLFCKVVTVTTLIMQMLAHGVD